MSLVTSPRVRLWGLLLALAVAFWLPRGLALNRYVTDDERLWLARSANFYQALASGNFAATYQREHPGVTVMWAGTAAFLWRYPAYAQDAPGQLGWRVDEIGPLLRAHGHIPMDLLAAGRLVLAVAITVVFVLSFIYAARLFGTWPAVFGLFLVAFDPFHIALSRLLHVDALLSSLMLLSLLALLYALQHDSRPALLLSAGAAGLAALTKVPGLFLIPFAGLLFLWQYREDRRAHRDDAAATLVQHVVIWVGVTFVVIVLLWPALWLAPITTVRQMFAESLNYATGDAHMTTVFFGGEVLRETDPGPSFYAINFLWRTTPIVLLGLPVALLALLFRGAPLAEDRRRHPALALLLFATLYLLAITAGAKKLDRYMLPAFAPIDVVAALGWFAGVAWLRLAGQRFLTAAATGSILVAACVQVILAVSTFPYFLSYFNPLMGGSAKAPEVLMIGRGEGLDRAAAYLNAKPNAEELHVLTWSTDNVAYLLDTQLISTDVLSDPRDDPSVGDLLNWAKLDYVVLYVHQWQRRLLPRQMLDYFATRTPEKVIRIHGLEYARIYDVQGALPPDFLVIGSPDRLTDWGDAIRLLSYDLPATPLQPGEQFTARFYLQNLAPLQNDVNVLVRIVGADGKELLRDEGWPWGSPTSQWSRYTVWPDGHEFTIPTDAQPGYYQVEVRFYDPETLEPLPASDAHTGEPVGTSRIVDYLTVGDVPSEPSRPLAPPVVLADTITLFGADVDALHGGQPLDVRLFWQADAPVSVDYTAFVHLIGPDGQLVAQHDKQPLDGFLPTSLWRVRATVTDVFELALPAEVPSGTYALRTGMYDPVTVERLPVTQGDEPKGDSIVLVTFTVE